MHEHFIASMSVWQVLVSLCRCDPRCFRAWTSHSRELDRHLEQARRRRRAVRSVVRLRRQPHGRAAGAGRGADPRRVPAVLPPPPGRRPGPLCARSPAPVLHALAAAKPPMRAMQQQVLARAQNVSSRNSSHIFISSCSLLPRIIPVPRAHAGVNLNIADSCLLKGSFDVRRLLRRSGAAERRGVAGDGEHDGAAGSARAGGSGRRAQRRPRQLLQVRVFSTPISVLPIMPAGVGGSTSSQHSCIEGSRCASGVNDRECWSWPDDVPARS